MCEQVIQQSPGYFKQFARKFKYFVTEKYPTLPADNFAFAFHNPKSDACTVSNVKHWHLLLYSSSDFIKGGYSVPCPYACFSRLILEGINFSLTGDIFTKLQRAVTYNEKYETDCSRPAVLRTKLPKVIKSSKHDQYTQTDLISSASLERYFKVMNGQYGGEFSQIMDAFISGYGSVNIQSHSMVTNFELTCSQAQCYCYNCTEQDN
jgi:hypothetical protein